MYKAKIVFFWAIILLIGFVNSDKINAKSDLTKDKKAVQYLTDTNKILKSLERDSLFVFRDEKGNIIIDGFDFKSVKITKERNLIIGADEIAVQFKLNSEGTKKFAEATEDNIGKIIYIIYNGQVIQTPRVSSSIEDGVVAITGLKNKKEAINFATKINIEIFHNKIASQVKVFQQFIESIIEE